MFSSKVVLSGHEAAVYCLIPFEDGILSGGGDGWVVHWNPEESEHGKLVANINDRVFCLLSPRLQTTTYRSKKILCGTLSGDLYWIDLIGKQAPRRWQFHLDGIFGLLQVDDAVLVAGGDGRLSRWSVDREEMIDFVQVDTVRLRSIVYLKGPGLLAIGTANGDIHLLHPGTLRTIHTLDRAHELTVFSMVDYGDWFYSSGRDGAIRWWQTAAPFKQLGVVAAHASTVNSMCALGLDENAELSNPPEHTNKDKLVSVGRDREVRIWNTGQQGLVLAKALIANRDGGHVASVNACCIASNYLFTAGDDRTIRCWKHREGVS